MPYVDPKGRVSEGLIDLSLSLVYILLSMIIASLSTCWLK